MVNLKRVLTHSIRMRIGGPMAIIAILATASIVGAAVFAEQSTGKSSAINLAGSLRMQSYKIAAIAASTWRTPEEKRAELELAATDFNRRLNHPVLLAAIPASRADPMTKTFQAIRVEWESSFKTLLSAQTDPAANQKQIDLFVASIDRFVQMLEDDFEGKIRAFRLFQGEALLLIVIITIIASYILHSQVVQPLGELVRTAHRVRTGDLSARSTETGDDELGQLGRTFNTMMEDLAQSYAHLEDRVVEKTKELQRSNESLELLYKTSRTLSEHDVTRVALDSVLHDIQHAIGAQAGVICTHAGAEPMAATGLSLRGVPLVRQVIPPSDEDICATRQCHECLEGKAISVHAASIDDSRSVDILVPLTDSGQSFGEMILRVAGDKVIEDWQLKLIEAIGRHIGVALAHAQRGESRRRLALLEERAAIARELHDSLAQSLAYLKIQMARLEPVLKQSSAASLAENIVGEIREGLSSAYRQLRELLTTFRLGMSGKGLRVALEEAAREYSSRGGFHIRIDNQLVGLELAANEEVHVLQIVREALSNVVQHAGATDVSVNLKIDHDHLVSVSIDDNGRGMKSVRSPEHHYGFAIMRDRAKSLHGNIQFLNREEGGTRIELVFTALSPFTERSNLEIVGA